MDWIERSLGWSPDGGSGVWEAVMAWAAAATVLLLTRAAVRRSRRLR